MSTTSDFLLQIKMKSIKSLFYKTNSVHSLLIKIHKSLYFTIQNS